MTTCETVTDPVDKDIKLEMFTMPHMFKRQAEELAY